jgi:hypothetical protein
MQPVHHPPPSRAPTAFPSKSTQDLQFEALPAAGGSSLCERLGRALGGAAPAAGNGTQSRFTGEQRRLMRHAAITQAAIDHFGGKEPFAHAMARVDPRLRERALGFLSVGREPLRDPSPRRLNAGAQALCEATEAAATACRAELQGVRLGRIAPDQALAPYPARGVGYALVLELAGMPSASPLARSRAVVERDRAMREVQQAIEQRIGRVDGKALTPWALRQLVLEVLGADPGRTDAPAAPGS